MKVIITQKQLEQIRENASKKFSCEKCDHSWKIEKEDKYPYLCHMCGYDSAKEKHNYDELENFWKNYKKEEEVTEKWSEKYKKSINCNNPKGFSQKAHCQGRKKKESIVRNDDIIEERSRSTNVSVLKQLQPYSKNPSYYVTFTDLEKVGVNPNNKFATPLGVYAYNLKDLWNDWISGDRFFGDDRKYVNLLKLNTDKIFDFQNYKNYKKDYQYLQNIYEKDYQSTTKMPFDDYVKSLEEKATLYEHSSEAAQIWDIIQSMFQINDKQANVGMATKRSTILWTKALRDMGYEAVIDRGSNIHLLQSSQAIFLSPQSYDIVDRFVNRTYKQTVENEDKWGSSKQPFWRPGVNPTIDNVIFKNDNGLKVLLIKRSATSKAEANKYAFPGGFHDTNQPKGQPWKNDRESAIQAAFRELAEETGLWIPTLNNIMKLVGSYEGNKRDPRDNQEAWSKTTAFAVLLPEEYNDRIVSGRDDAQEAIWVPVEQAQKMDLAFDHNQILNDALSTLNLNESNYQNLWLQFLEEAKKKVNNNVDVYEQGKKYNQKIPEIRFLPINVIKRQEYDFRPETLKVSDDVAKKMDFSQPIEVTAYRFPVTGWGSTIPPKIVHLSEEEQNDDTKPDVMLIDGHHRLAAAIQTGRSYLPVEVTARNAKGEKLNALIQLSQKIEKQHNKSINEKKDYKPNFSREKKQGLHGWFARNKGKGWVNCRTGGPCGRSDADSGGKYPACRPTKAQCKSAGKGPLRKKKSSKPISWVKKKKKD